MKIKKKKDRYSTKNIKFKNFIFSLANQFTISYEFELEF